MEKPWGHYCLNNATGKHFSMSAPAITIARKNDSAWDKKHTIIYGIDIDGRRIKTDEEIGKEKEAAKKIADEFNAGLAEKKETEKAEKTEKKPKK